MKLYQISSPGSTPTLFKSEVDGKSTENVSVGESGRGRNEGVIPIVGEGPEFRVKKTDEGGVVLVRGNWSEEDRCLVIINTVGAYSRSRQYGIFDASGLTAVSSGTIAFGQAGRTNSGEEVLAIVEPGANFRLNSKYDSTWYWWTGSYWNIESPAQRKARLALLVVAQGGGEWL